jgi:heme/copper-type cytochrome/quinol oxidase subunit 3
MLFAGLLAAWFDLRELAPTWPPPNCDVDPLRATIGTIALGIGSVLMVLAQRAIARNDIRTTRMYLGLGIACAIGFCWLALTEWTSVPFGIASNAYGTLFFVLTGTHLAHVLAGIVLLSALTIFLDKPAFVANNRAGVEAISYYWHFLFIIWLALWSAIYELK